MLSATIDRRQFLCAASATAALTLLPGWTPWLRAESNLAVELGVCTSFENSTLLKDCGFRFIEENVEHILMPKADDAAFDKVRQSISSVTLPIRSCKGFISKDMKIVGEQVNMDSIIRYAETALKRANKLGISRIVLGSGVSRNITDGFPRQRATEQFINFAKCIAPIAQVNQVIVVLEPLNKKECNFINRVDESLAIVKAVAHPAFQQHADLYHMMCEGEGPDSLIKAGKLLRHCHVATRKRKPPGVEKTDLRPYFKALKAIGYSDGISIECNWKDFKNELPVAYNELNTQLTSI